MRLILIPIRCKVTARVDAICLEALVLLIAFSQLNGMDRSVTAHVQAGHRTQHRVRIPLSLWRNYVCAHVQTWEVPVDHVWFRENHWQKVWWPPNVRATDTVKYSVLETVNLIHKLENVSVPQWAHRVRTSHDARVHLSNTRPLVIVCFQHNQSMPTQCIDCDMVSCWVYILSFCLSVFYSVQIVFCFVLLFERIVLILVCVLTLWLFPSTQSVCICMWWARVYTEWRRVWTESEWDYGCFLRFILFLRGLFSFSLFFFVFLYLIHCDVDHF